jgi:hypothetical protein
MLAFVAPSLIQFEPVDDGELVAVWSGLGIATALSLLAVLLVPSAANATYWSGGMPTASWTISNYSYNSQWQPGMNQAVANWNSRPTPASITKSSSPKGTIVAKSLADNPSTSQSSIMEYRSNWGSSLWILWTGWSGFLRDVAAPAR